MENTARNHIQKIVFVGILPIIGLYIAWVTLFHIFTPVHFNIWTLIPLFLIECILLACLFIYDFYTFFDKAKRKTKKHLVQMVNGSNHQLMNNINTVMNDKNMAKLIQSSQLKQHESIAFWDEEFVAPFSGELVPLHELNDPVFGTGQVGHGFAVLPDDGHVVSPVNGIVQEVFPLQHAVEIKTYQGKDVIVHMGMNCVNSTHTGYTVYVKQGDVVHCGSPLAYFDVDMFTALKKETLSPVFMPNIHDVTLSIEPTGYVKAGQKLNIHITKIRKSTPPFN